MRQLPLRHFHFRQIQVDLLRRREDVARFGVFRFDDALEPQEGVALHELEVIGLVDEQFEAKSQTLSLYHHSE